MPVLELSAGLSSLKLQNPVNYKRRKPSQFRDGFCVFSPDGNGILYVFSLKT